MKNKKTNPRRRPATWADVERSKRVGQAEAVKLAWSILFYELTDKEGMTVEELQRIWDKVNDVSDSVAKGYVNVADLRNVLREEYGINIV